MIKCVFNFRFSLGCWREKYILVLSFKCGLRYRILRFYLRVDVYVYKGVRILFIKIIEYIYIYKYISNK